ncbi:copper homeostasis protein CutC [Fusobacterium sp. MFO224]|uniref:copper homeostasis protein CutC n=1 Tax=Fusobacterium sp. MFO224 TaxID=3378070 RepID=UPI00385521A2
MLKEVCVGSFLEAKMAEKRGAGRIELCDRLDEGGTTASYGTIKKCVESLNIPVFALVRPRSGDFIYSCYEIDIMREDIKLCKGLGVKGIVIGILNNKNEIDYETLRDFVKLAHPLEVTFHKAIDEVKDPVKEIPKLKAAGVSRILSSGKGKTALEGKKLLNKMIEAAGANMTVIVSGKITKENFDEVSQEIKSSEYHGRKIL